MFSVADHIKDHEVAIISKLDWFIRKIWSPLENSEWPTLIALGWVILLGLFAGFVYEPRTRLDSLFRGIAIFSILNPTPVTEEMEKELKEPTTIYIESPKP